MQLFWGDGTPCGPRALSRPCTLIHPSTACAEGLGAVIAHRFWAHRQVRGRVGNRHTRSWSGLSWNSAELRICFVVMAFTHSRIPFSITVGLVLASAGRSRLEMLLSCEGVVRSEMMGRLFQIGVRLGCIWSGFLAQCTVAFEH
jgi:hypothetical protein